MVRICTMQEQKDPRIHTAALSNEVRSSQHRSRSWYIIAPFLVDLLEDNLPSSRYW